MKSLTVFRDEATLFCRNAFSSFSAHCTRSLLGAYLAATRSLAGAYLEPNSNKLGAFWRSIYKFKQLQQLGDAGSSVGNTRFARTSQPRISTPVISLLRNLQERQTRSGELLPFWSGATHLYRSLRRSVGLSVCLCLLPLYLLLVVGLLVFFSVFTTPAHLHATRAAVYTALLSYFFISFFLLYFGWLG